MLLDLLAAWLPVVSQHSPSPTLSQPCYGLCSHTHSVRCCRRTCAHTLSHSITHAPSPSLPSLPPPPCSPPSCLQLLYDKEKATSESRKQAADKAADELRQEAAKRQRLEDTNRVSDDADGGSGGKQLPPSGKAGIGAKGN